MNNKSPADQPLLPREPVGAFGSFHGLCKISSICLLSTYLPISHLHISSIIFYQSLLTLSLITCVYVCVYVYEKEKGLLWITTNTFNFLFPTSTLEARGSQLNWFVPAPHYVLSRNHGQQKHLGSSQVTNAGKARTQKHQGNMKFLVGEILARAGIPLCTTAAGKESHCLLLDKFNQLLDYPSVLSASMNFTSSFYDTHEVDTLFSVL